MAPPLQTRLSWTEGGSGLSEHGSTLSSRKAAASVAVLLTLIGMVRIASTYAVLSQAFDEPAHVACGMERLEQGSYKHAPHAPPALGGLALYQLPAFALRGRKLICFCSWSGACRRAR